MTNDKILKAATILLLATTVPFVGWSSSRAQGNDDWSSRTQDDAEDIALQPTEDDPPTAASSDSKFSDPEFWQAVIKHHEKMLFQHVKATPDQQTKISKIFADAREAKKPLRSQMHEQRKQVHELLADANATDQQITDKVHDLRQTEDQLKDQRLDTMLKVRSVLTPQQREALVHRWQGGSNDPCCEEEGTHSKHMTSKHSESLN